MSHLCEYCGKSFTRRHNLSKHSEAKHGGILFLYNCVLCRKNFANRHKYNSHMNKHLERKNWLILRSAFSGATKIFRRALNTNSFLELFSVKPHIENLVEKELVVYPRLKLNLSVVTEYVLDSENRSSLQIEQFILKSGNKIVTANNQTELSAHIDSCLNELRVREDQLNLRESGWSLKAILFIDVHLTQINMLL